MCRAAKEIQQHWKPTNGDFYIRADRTKKAVGIMNYDTRVLRLPKFYKRIWLPRQDQIQTFLNTSWSPYEIADFFWGWVDSIDCPSGLKSMEQLWFCFMMLETFGKRWSGTDWEDSK